MSREKQIKDFLDKTPYVFVYGTLQKKYGNNRLLDGAAFLGSDTTKEKMLMGTTGIPYVFHSDVVPEKFKHLLRPVRGEVFKVDESHVEGLDGLEGCHYEDKERSHYWRRLVTTKSLGKTCWMYTQESFMAAGRCYAANINEQGEWKW